MPIPTDSPEFATDSVFASDGDTWSGDPNKADPGAGRKAEGYEPDTVPAEWLNWQINLIGKWIVWFRDLLGGSTGTAEWTYPSARSRSRVVSPAEGLGAVGASNWQLGFDILGQSQIQPASGADAQQWQIPVILPVGAGFTSIEVRWVVGSNRASADRWKMGLWRAGLTGAPAQIGGTIEDSGSGTATETLVTGAYTVLATERYYIAIQSPTGSVGVGTDILSGLRLNYTVPGPHPGA